MTLQFEDKNMVLTDLQRSQLKVISKTIADLANDIGAHEPIPVDKSYMNSADFERLLLPLLPDLISENSDVQDITKKIEALSTDDLASLMRMAIYMDVTRLQEPIARILNKNDVLSGFVDNPGAVLQKLNIPLDGNVITSKVSTFLLRNKVPTLIGPTFLNSKPECISLKSKIIAEAFPEIGTVSWSADGTFFTGRNPAIGLFAYDMVNERIKCRLDKGDIKHTSAIWSVSNSLLAVSYSDNSIGIWDIDNECQKSVLRFDKKIKNLVWSPDNKYLAICFHEKTIVVNVDDGLVAYDFNEYGTPRWSPDSSKLAFIKQAGASVWNLETYSKELDTVQLVADLQEKLVNIGWQPTGNLVAIAYNNKIFIWNNKTGAVKIIEHPINGSFHIYWNGSEDLPTLLSYNHDFDNLSDTYAFNLNTRKSVRMNRDRRNFYFLPGSGMNARRSLLCLSMQRCVRGEWIYRDEDHLLATDVRDPLTGDIVLEVSKDSRVFIKWIQLESLLAVHSLIRDGESDLSMYDMRNVDAVYEDVERLSIPQALILKNIIDNKRFPWIKKFPWNCISPKMSQTQALLKSYFDKMPEPFKEGARRYVGLPSGKPSCQSFMHAFKPYTIANAAFKAIGWNK